MFWIVVFVFIAYMLYATRTHFTEEDIDDVVDRWLKETDTEGGKYRDDT